MSRYCVNGVTALWLSALVGGCASISAGSSQTITVNSNIEGAEVFLNGEQVGTTPVTTEVKRADEAVLEVRKAGYRPVAQTLDTEITGWFWGNILLGGTLGSTTDAATGAMWEYEPSTLYAQLTPETPAATAPPASPVAPSPTSSPEPDAPTDPATPPPATPPSEPDVEPPTDAEPPSDAPDDSNEATDGDAGTTDAHDAALDEARLRHFVLMNYDAIGNDLARGRGEYLEALTQLLTPPTGSTARHLRDKLMRAQRDSETTVAFSDRVIELHRAARGAR